MPVRDSAGTTRTPAVDTIRARLESVARRQLHPRADRAEKMVVLLIREQDAFTCEDLGRQSRELRSWAENMGLPFVVWAETEDDTRLPVFLRREHISDGVVLLTRSPLRVEGGGTIRSPAAMVVDVATGELHGFAHPERVRNVRQRSFAQELSDIDGA